jgi:homocitrate synthase
VTSGAPDDPGTGWQLIDSTLREGEQCSKASFRTEDKLELARALDAFGVETIEVTSPAASPRSRRDAALLARLPLQARVISHCRCSVEDVQQALDTGVRGLGLLYSTSRVLREASHGRSAQQIIDALGPPIERALSAGLEVRFSCEDAFRSEPGDLLAIYAAAERLGVHRVGLADTVGIATPRQVYGLVGRVRAQVQCGIGFHGHDDTGCAIANAFEAVCAGATHVDVSVLGIGERVGITPLGGFVARMASLQPQEVSRRYRLPLLRELERLLARLLRVEIPFDNYLTGETAFSHKAGMHLKAIASNPRAYEVNAPEAFGVERRLVVGSALTGRAGVGERARAIGLSFADDQLRAVTAQIKALSDTRDLSEEQVDRLLREAV